MNAQTPLLPTDEAAGPMLTTSIFLNASVLRLLTQQDTFDSISELARIAGKDKSNLRTSLTTLEEDGALVRTTDGDKVVLRLTEFGRKALQGFDFAEGRLALPVGFVMRTYGQLQPHPLNPRKDWDSEEAVQSLDDMRASIVLRGIRYPLEIRLGEDGSPDYIVSGERRWRGLGLGIEDGDIDADYPIVCVVKTVDDEQHLVLALEENIQRRNLSHVEEARAYAYLRDVKKWGTDRIAETFGDLSRKVVQNKLRLLEPQNAELLQKVEAGDITYHQALKAMIQPKAQGGEGLFGDVLHPQRKGDEVKPLELTPKQALIVIELADRCEKQPHQHFDGYTRIAALPTSGDAQRLLERGVIAGRSGMGMAFAKVMLHSANAKTWLTDNGFYEDRAGLLRQARTAIVGADKAAHAEEAGLYVTDWLNVDESAPAAGPASPEPAPRAPLPLPPLQAPTGAEDPEPIMLDPAQFCALVEVAFKAEIDKVPDPFGTPMALTLVGATTHRLLGSLVLCGFLDNRYTADHRNAAMLTGDGENYLAEHGYPLPISEDALRAARAPLGYDEFSLQLMSAGERYVTDALNLPKPIVVLDTDDVDPAEKREEWSGGTDVAPYAVGEALEPEALPAHPSAPLPAPHIQPPSALDFQASADFSRLVSDRLSRDRPNASPHWGAMQADQIADRVVGFLEDGDLGGAGAAMAALGHRAGLGVAGPKMAQAFARHIDRLQQEG